MSSLVMWLEKLLVMQELVKLATTVIAVVNHSSPQQAARYSGSIIKRVHPYEEVALDIYPLLNEEELDGNG